MRSSTVAGREMNRVRQDSDKNPVGKSQPRTMPALIIPIWISDRLIVMLRVSLIGLAMFAVEAPLAR